MAAAGRSGKIRLWSMANGSKERDIETDGRRIRALAFSPDGRQLAAAGTSASIRVYDAATGNVAATLSTRPAKNYSLAFLDNNRLAAGGTDNCVWIWDLKTQRAAMQLKGHTGTVAALACDGTGTTLVSGSYDTTIRIWDLTAEPVPSTAQRGANGTAR
jgi:WD40 repeat protein